MEDRDTIKALECCPKRSFHNYPCNDCPLLREVCFGGASLMKLSLDLINRQKAEIERLNSPYEMQVEASKKLENSIKAEAVKEFAARLKEKAHRCDLSTDEHEYYSVGVFEIDNLVKEMVGEG